MCACKTTSTTNLLLLADAHEFHHEHVLVALECIHLVSQTPILPDLDRSLLALCAGGCAARGLAPMDVLEGIAAVPQKVFVGKLPSIRVDLAKPLDAMCAYVIHAGCCAYVGVELANKG